MSNSQIESTKDKSEEIRKRAFRLILALGTAGILWGFIFASVSEAGRQPLSLFSSFGAGAIQLFGAYLIYRRRVFLGVAVAASTAPIVALITIAQSAGIGTVVVVAVLIIYMMILPLIVTQEDGLSRIQVGAVFVAAALILADLYWPYPRNMIEPELATATYIFLGLLLLVFAAVLVRRFPTFSLRGKLISTTLVVTTVAIAGVAFGVNNFTSTALTTEGGKQLEALARSQGLLIGELLAREVNSLQSLTLDGRLAAAIEYQNARYSGSKEEILAEIVAKDNSWRNGSRFHPYVGDVVDNAVSDKLREFTALFPASGNLMVTDRYGALVAATNFTEQYYHGEEVWWDTAYGAGFGKTYISEPTPNERGSHGFLQIALPIFSSQTTGPSHLIGILYSNYSLKSLEDLMVASQVGETQSITVHLPGYQLALDENDKLQIFTEEIVSEAVLEEAREAEAGYAFVNLDGVTHLFSVEHINTLNHQPIVDDLNWWASVQQAEAEALASVSQQQRLIILLGTLVVLVAGGAAAFTGTWLTAPILRLTTIAKEVSNGNLEVQAEVTTQDEIGTLATVFNGMTAQVRESIHTLEQRVADRTRALEISGNVSRQLSNILDQQELVKAVVKQVRTAFNYYHAHIYLFDDIGENLIMMGGTGEAGRQMLANKHQIAAGKGLVGRAGQTGRPVLVPDTSKAEDWLPNPLLPYTKAEIAVPIMSGDKVWGVLDVQHNVTNGLSQVDVDLLDAIANQAAVALRNARLYEEAQEQAQREALVNEINQKILNTKDVHEALQVAAREVGRALNASQTIVRFTQDSLGEKFGDTKPLNGVNGQQK